MVSTINIFNVNAKIFYLLCSPSGVHSRVARHFMQRDQSKWWRARSEWKLLVWFCHTWPNHSSLLQHGYSRLVILQPSWHCIEFVDTLNQFVVIVTDLIILVVDWTYRFEDKKKIRVHPSPQQLQNKQDCLGNFALRLFHVDHVYKKAWG